MASSTSLDSLAGKLEALQRTLAATEAKAAALQAERDAHPDAKAHPVGPLTNALTDELGTHVVVEMHGDSNPAELSIKSPDTSVATATSSNLPGSPAVNAATVPESPVVNNASTVPESPVVNNASTVPESPVVNNASTVPASPVANTAVPVASAPSASASAPAPVVPASAIVPSPAATLTIPSHTSVKSRHANPPNLMFESVVAEDNQDEEADEEANEENVNTPILPKKMPKGWKEFRRENGAYYYQHVKSGKVQWEKPIGPEPHASAEVPRPSKGSRPSSPLRALPKKMPAGWKEPYNPRGKLQIRRQLRGTWTSTAAV